MPQQVRGHQVWETVYSTAADLSLDAIAAGLRALLVARRQPLPRWRGVVMDTFDGRVRRTGGRLTRTGQDDAPVIRWRDRGGRSVTAEVNSPPNFSWDLPRGPLHEGLAPLIGPRRLFSQAHADGHGCLLEVQDARQKTVARVEIEAFKVRAPDARAWRSMPTLVTVTGLRGYEDEYARLLPVVMSRPGVTACAGGFHGAVLRQIGAPIDDDITQFRVELDAGVRAGEGARRIHRALLRALRLNEPGVRAGLDTEFLHDFRVAVRRTRSLLGQLKHVFPEKAHQRFRADFSWLGHLTGPARDLDVLLLALNDRWRGSQVADHHAILDLIQAEQAVAHRALAAALDSERYGRLIADWQSFLDEPSGSPLEAVNSHQPLRQIVASRAWRLIRRIADRAGDVNARTAPGELHAIRIEAKKLRYLIDATPGFFDRNDLDLLLGALKKLQRALGDFNDADVQEARFATCARRLADAGAPAGAIALVEGLAGDTRARRRELRAAVVDRLGVFRQRQVRSSARRAFKDLAETPQ